MAFSAAAFYFDSTRTIALTCHSERSVPTSVSSGNRISDFRSGRAVEESLFAFIALPEGSASFRSNVRYFASTRKSLPVISFGFGMPKTPSMVGAMSRSAPPGLSRSEPSSCRRINGTGFVVW
jgi:hypothetical protein